jgi:murein DD-endopeptidase MepM/ murein hydrolase activator NlpD
MGTLAKPSNPSSGFGPRDMNGRSYHYGTDWPAPIGSPFYTNKELTVTKAEVQTGYGNVVYAVDAQGTEYRFAHLDSFAGGVKTGSTIPAGGQVGYSGITGQEKDGSQTSTGAHLHYEVRRGGVAVDPLTTIDPTTGKPYINNASFEQGNGTSLRTSTPKKDSNYTPNGTAVPRPTPAPNNKPTQPDFNKDKKPNAQPDNSKPSSIKLPRINPLLKLGD